MVAEEEMVYVRNGIFKKWAPRLNQNRCAISDIILISSFGYNLFNACHNIPFSEGQDDWGTNGFALCPNLHRAFNRGLISIDEEFKVMVSTQIMEDKSHPFGLTNLSGLKIILPNERHHQPEQGKWIGIGNEGCRIVLKLKRLFKMMD